MFTGIKSVVLGIGMCVALWGTLACGGAAWAQDEPDSFSKDDVEAIKAELANDKEVRQLILVRHTGDTQAELTLLLKEKNASGCSCGCACGMPAFEGHESQEVWREALRCPALIGKNGLGKQKEGDDKTPKGIFNLPLAFGIKDDPGALVPYVKVNDNHYWCGDKLYYNQLIDIKEHPHKCTGSEHLVDCVPSYNYALWIDYNSECVFGKGSAIFLHCFSGKNYTAGCVAVSEDNMKALLRAVDKGAKIVIY